MHLNFPIGEGSKSYYMFGFSDTVYELNLINLEYHQSVARCLPNLVSEFSYLKDLDNVEPFNISEVNGVK